MQTSMQNFIFNEHGTTAIEYGMIASLVFLTIVGAVQELGANVFAGFYSKIAVAFQ
jgi:Flp pilus assembly pilin Flp